MVVTPSGGVVVVVVGVSVVVVVVTSGVVVVVVVGVSVVVVVPVASGVTEHEFHALRSDGPGLELSTWKLAESP